MPNWTKAQIWDDWGAITRLLWSGRIAFEAEARRWENSHISDPNSVSVRFSDAGGEYVTSLENHLDAIGPRSYFCTVILVQSYALLERHAKGVQYASKLRDWSILFDVATESTLEEISRSRLNGGIESWGSHLLELVRQDWNSVYKGRSGLVEISEIRNAVAHRHEVTTSYHIENAKRRGTCFPFKEGQRIEISFDQLHEYRGRIRSICRVLTDGAYHLMVGTHSTARD